MSVSRQRFNRLVRPLTDHLLSRRHEKSDQTSSRSAPAPLIFETLEPRILLAADPLGITAGYAFDETSGTTAVDASGHGITGTLTNGPTFTPGKNGNAVTLDGVNDYVNLGNPTALQFTGSMTVSAWVYASSFPVDDAAVVSKRAAGEVGFQLDITKDTGPRTIGFKLTNSSGGQMFRYGATTLQLNTWYYVTGVYNAANQALDVYLNGALDNGTLQGTVTSSQQNSTTNVTIGRRAGFTGNEFAGRIDDVRIADHALTQDQIQADMVTPLGPSGPDVTAPTVSLTAPAANAIVAGTVTVSASASDNVGVASVQFLLDGANLGAAGSTSPYSVSWNTTTATNGTHRLQARATDAAGNSTTTTDRFITVDNQAPTGTIVINSGATATNNRNVTLTLSASDALSSVTQMRFSNTGTGAFSTPEPFATTKAWTLSTGAGTKTVFVQFMDAAGNWSTAAISDTIILDTTAPTISARTATNITGSSATITWTTNELATSQVEYGLTTSYGSTTTLDLTLVTAHSVAITGLAPNTTYNWRVRSKDAAGNEAISANSTFTTAAVSDTIPPTVSWSGPAANSILLGTVTLSAAASDNLAVGGVQFLLDGNTLGTEDTTSPYSISWNTTTASSGTHTLQARGRDTSGNTATTAAISVTVDNLAPTGAVVINGNAPATKNQTVTLTLSASDTQGAVTQMRFSNDGTTFSAAEAYATSKSWTLTSGDGTKTVYAQYQDVAGNWSTAATDTIVLDTTAPSISAITTTVVTSSSVTITWTTNEASTSQIDYGPTTSYGSTTPLDTTLVTVHGVTLIGLASNATYNFRIHSSDALGNEAVSTNATFIIDTAAPSIPTGLTATAISSSQINLSWTASTDNVAVTGYQVLRGGVVIATVASTTYSNTGLAAGTNYVYTVKAVDAAGNASLASASANATTFASDTTAPTVAITTPTPTATVSGTVSVAANASDNVAVAGVQFFMDGTALGAEDTTSPYSVLWDTNTATSGSHILTARARDAAGNATTSAQVTVTVANTQALGLQAGYAFDEGTGTTSTDKSGHGLTGTLTNGATWTTAGKYGNALSLDGVNDFVDLGNPAALQMTGNMTISAWIFATSFPADDAAVVSKRTSGELGFQLDTTVDTGQRTIGFKLTNSSGGQMFRYGATTLQTNVWYHIAGVYDVATQTLHVYLNGQLDDGVLQGTVTGTQQNSPANVNIGQRPGVAGYSFTGRVDDVRIYNRALTQAQILTDMNTPLGNMGSVDPIAPQVLIDSPAANAQVKDIITVTADATDNIGVAGVQFFVDGIPTGGEDTTDPYALNWDTRTVSNGAHSLTARARDVNGNTALSAPITVNVVNTSHFQNVILATGLDLPTAMTFLPDGRMLVLEITGTVVVLQSPYIQADPTPFLKITNIGSIDGLGFIQGAYDIALDPNFSSNHYYYVSYTAASPNRDRLSRFTANANLTGTVPNSELILYQDTETAGSDHHAGSINFANDGMLFFTTGENFVPAEAQDLTKSRGKILRLNPVDGSAAPGNPFSDGPGGKDDRIWALGLRNPYRAYYDASTDRLIIGDVGGNDWSTAIEEIDIGVRGANYGWPNVEAPNGDPAYTAPVYYWPHNLRDAAVTAGFVYHAPQVSSGFEFPSAYEGNFFFADYTQNWIKRMTFDANGNVTGVFNFEPPDGSVDGPYGDIVYLREGPDGALYYLDLGYSDVSHAFGLSKIHRIEFIDSNLPPTAIASTDTTQGLPPLTVNFSSNGSSDPENQPLTYLWTFGDGTTSTQANPQYTYASRGLYQARLTVSDGVNSTFSTPLSISVGNRPVGTLTTTPSDGGFFRAGDVISFSGTATDVEDGVLPASAYTWNIDFLHEGHVHPGTPLVGVTSGSFTIPTTGHDFSGFTRYRITLTVTDSDGLQSTQSALVFPEKVNLTFDTAPGGLTIYLDGIAHTAPFVYDDLIGFNHTIEARNQTIGGNTYNFASWSDSGAQTHTIVTPSTNAAFTAAFTVAVAPPAFVQVNSATPQTNQTQVNAAYQGAQVAGDTNIIVIGWNNATSNINSIIDSAGNVYQIAAPVVRGSGISQAIYYAKNIKASNAGANTVTVTFNASTPNVDLRITEYSGLDKVNPLDVNKSASGTGTTANSGAVTTTAANELIFAAGTTVGGFSGAGTGFTSRIITSPDADIVEDRLVTAVGSYSATAPLAGSAAWVMQMVTFKAGN